MDGVLIEDRADDLTEEICLARCPDLLCMQQQQRADVVTNQDFPSRCSVEGGNWQQRLDRFVCS